MNKIKLLYDVIKTMKERKECKGEIKIDFLCEGDEKKIKHSSVTEFDVKDCHSHHECCSYFHGRVHEHFRQMHEGKQCCGMKEKLTFLAFLLKLIDNMDVKEIDGNSVEMVLKIDGIPEEFKQAIHEKFQDIELADSDVDVKHRKIMQNIITSDNVKIQLNVLVNEKREIQKLILQANGGIKNNDLGSHEFRHSIEITAR